MISMDMQLQEGTGDTQLVDRIKHTQLLLKVLRTEFQGLDRSISDCLYLIIPGLKDDCEVC